MYHLLREVTNLLLRGIYHLLLEGTGHLLGGMYHLPWEGTTLLLRRIYHLILEGTCLLLLQEGMDLHHHGGIHQFLREGTGLHHQGGIRRLLREGTGLHHRGGIHHLLWEGTGLLLLGGKYHLLRGGTVLPQNADPQLAGIFLHLQKGGGMIDHGLLLEGAAFLLVTEEVIGVDLHQSLLFVTIIEDRLGSDIRPGADILPDEELLQGFILDVDLRDEGNGHPLLTGILELGNLGTTCL